MIINYPDGRVVQDGTPAELALFNFKIAEITALHKFQKLLDGLSKASKSEAEKK